MTVVYIAGAAPGCGVTAVTAGMASLLKAAAGKAASTAAPDADAAFLSALGGGDSPATGWPVALAPSDTPDAIAAKAAAARPQGAETLVVHGAGSGADGQPFALDAAIARALGAQVALVTTPALDVGATAAQARAAFDGALAGVIVNRTPAYGAAAAADGVRAACEAAGATLFGCVPEDRRLAAPTVGQIADLLGAACINRDALDDPDAAMSRLVEHVMVGGLFLDTGVYVFGRHEHKAVVVRGDRPDLQMAALETSTVCLVLTEGQQPIQYIEHHAALTQTPLLLVDAPTLATLEALHDAAAQATALSAAKAERSAELLAAHCDLSPLTGALQAR